MSSSRSADDIAEEFIDFDDVDFGPDAYGVLMNMDFGGMNLPEIIEELKETAMTPVPPVPISSLCPVPIRSALPKSMCSMMAVG
mgnify:CR=1 FL=1